MKRNARRASSGKAAKHGDSLAELHAKVDALAKKVAEISKKVQ